jgi:hypothetical protein
MYACKTGFAHEKSIKLSLQIRLASLIIKLYTVGGIVKAPRREKIKSESKMPGRTPGTDVIILEIFSRKKLAETLAFFAQTVY